MAINDLDILWTFGGPDEASPELIVYADAVLPGPPALQGFQTVPGRNAQIVERTRPIEHGQFTHRDGFNVHETPDAFSLEKPVRVGALERGYRHPTIVSNDDSIVKRYANTADPGLPASAGAARRGPPRPRLFWRKPGKIRPVGSESGRSLPDLHTDRVSVCREVGGDSRSSVVRDIDHVDEQVMLRAALAADFDATDTHIGQSAQFALRFYELAGGTEAPDPLGLRPTRRKDLNAGPRT